jgi:hypothetical protein
MQNSNERTSSQSIVPKSDNALPSSEDPCGEQHFSILEIANCLNLSEDTVRRLFLHEPGVFVFSRPSHSRKRRYTTLRVPLSFLERVRLKYTIW